MHSMVVWRQSGAKAFATNRMRLVCRSVYTLCQKRSYCLRLADSSRATQVRSLKQSTPSRFDCPVRHTNDSTNRPPATDLHNWCSKIPCSQLTRYFGICKYLIFSYAFGRETMRGRRKRPTLIHRLVPGTVPQG